MDKSKKDKDNKIVLPHHEQQPLCTNRLAYRQGRKLTAVKVNCYKKSNLLRNIQLLKCYFK